MPDYIPGIPFVMKTGCRELQLTPPATYFHLIRGSWLKEEAEPPTLPAIKA